MFNSDSYKLKNLDKLMSLQMEEKKKESKVEVQRVKKEKLFWAVKL